MGPPTAAAAPALADAPPSPARAADAPSPPKARSGVEPLVRATRWVCEEQSCDGRPQMAYDYLPAVAADGSVAFVEEPDGWGHHAEVGVHVVPPDGADRHVPVFAPAPTGTYADFAKHRAEHEATLRKANDALWGRGFRPLVRLSRHEPRGTLLVFSSGGTRVELGYPDERSVGSPRFDSLRVYASGALVVERKRLPDMTGCSERDVTVDGVDLERRVLALTFTNGMTTHACDGVPEPQIRHVVRW